MARHRDQPVTGRPPLDILADRRDLGADFAPRREGAFGLELIFILDDQHVGIVDRADQYLDQQFAPPGGRHRPVRQHQRFRPASGLRQ